MRNAPIAAALISALLLGLALGQSPGSGGLLEPEAAQAGRACPGAGLAPSKLTPQRAARLVGCLINKRRANRGLSPLKWKKTVSRAAVSHTKRMKRGRCFAHTCPGEPSLLRRLELSGYLPCGCNWSASEAIAWGMGSRRGSPKAIVRAWMRSPTHRATLLGSYEHFGVGVRRGSPVKDKRRHGTYTVNVGYKR